MKKRIVITREIREYIINLYNIDERTVQRAVKYETDTKLARAIRAVALQKGGEVVGGDQLETCFPVGKMIQTYGNRLRIETLNSDGTTTIYIDGKKRESHKNLSVRDYTKLQERMIALVDTQR